MPYVMMPVPEEHVEEVMRFILRAIARASIEPWDAESVNQIYSEVDEASRSLLAFTARASLESGDLAADVAARQIQLSVREIWGMTNELNIRTREMNRTDLIFTRMVSERLPNGRVTEKRVFIMEPEVAELVRAAEQAELAGTPHPLGGESA